MMKCLTRLVLIASILATSGCAFWRPDKIHYSWNDAGHEIGQPRSNTACENCVPALTNGDFVGVALSGGGARASVFGAAAIEALAEAGLMDSATHISSVSGGGFAAAYYALNKPAPCSQAARQSNPDCVSEGFASFKQAMRHNFLSDLTMRQIVRPGRFTSPTRRLSSLQDALDHQFIKDATFDDLPSTPVLLINGARYDDGRRFVFSNQPIPEQASAIPPFTQTTLRTASFSQPGCTRPTPEDFSLALAIAISAGFPPLLGPAAIEMPATCDGGPPIYWHLGDGGILDNTGVETLEDFALNADTNGDRAKRVFIFAMDAGRSTAPNVMMQQRNLKLWTSDPGRVVDIVGMRANAYRNLKLETSYKKSGVTFHTFKMRYTDAVITEWPASCGEREGGAEVINAYLAAIPTNFKITDCNADLIELAAHNLVTRMLDENRELLRESGLSPAPNQ